MKFWLCVLLSGCAHLALPPSPDDACRNPCIAAIGRVDVYGLDHGICTCYRAPNPPDPGDSAQFPLDAAAKKPHSARP